MNIVQICEPGTSAMVMGALYVLLAVAIFAAVLVIRWTFNEHKTFKRLTDSDSLKRSPLQKVLDARRKLLNVHDQ